MDINMNDIKSHQETFLDEAADEIKLEEADDGDEAEEVEEYVTLGLVQKPKNSNFLLCHLFPSKAGGFPAWLDPVDRPLERSRRCGFCKEPLQFLLQIYAPISEKNLLFIACCMCSCAHPFHVFSRTSMNSRNTEKTIVVSVKSSVVNFLDPIPSTPMNHQDIMALTNH